MDFVEDLGAKINKCRLLNEYINIFIPPHVSGGVLCFHIGCVSVHPSVWPPVCPSLHLSIRTSFPFDSLSIYKRISFKFCICVGTNNVSLGIVNGHFSIIYHRVMALFNVQKMFFGI